MSVSSVLVKKKTQTKNNREASTDLITYYLCHSTSLSFGATGPHQLSKSKLTHADRRELGQVGGIVVQGNAGIVLMLPVFFRES